MKINYDDYYTHLSKISFTGKIYKKFFLAPIIYIIARVFGGKIIEIGSGIGSGLVGAFPKRTIGLEINPSAVKYCKDSGLNVQIIYENKPYPMPDKTVDCCVLDNVLEHLNDPSFTLCECARITNTNGGLILAVPGIKGFASDSDHKIFYDSSNLEKVHSHWKLLYSFSTPFLIKSNFLSRNIKQYCLIVVYKKDS